nr:MAG TPA: hypothetical protein [Caudoviricetes sp.]
MFKIIPSIFCYSVSKRLFFITQTICSSYFWLLTSNTNIFLTVNLV